MQLKALVIALAALPVSVFAQQNNSSHTTQQVVETVELAPGSKKVMDAQIITNTDSLAHAERKLADATLPKSTVNNLPGKIVEDSPFKQVPLIGDLKYYGKDHSKMLDYTKNYMRVHSKRLGRLKDGKASQYFPIIEPILEKHKIPHELKYLAVIESALNENARSPVGAVGPWQFMAPTGKLMGLKITKGVDERKHWHKSTEAACKYLNYLYERFDDWLLVVASYNSGPRPVINAINKTGKNDYWSIKPYLPKETQNHVLAFVATATIMEKLPHLMGNEMPADFDWASLNEDNRRKKIQDKPANPLLAKFSSEEIKKMAIVRINKPIDLDILAYELQVDKRTLSRWNYDYFDFVGDKAGNTTYNLRIPKDKLDRFIERKDYLEKATRF